MNLVDELHKVAAALRQAKITYAICGGVAVTAHGATRSTKDIDLLVAPDDLPRALEAVRALGYVFASLPMVFDKGTNKERTVHRVSKLDGDAHLMLDFLLAQGSFAQLLHDRVLVDLAEGPLDVVSRESLAYMKRLAGRAQDLADLNLLGMNAGGAGDEGGA